MSLYGDIIAELKPRESMDEVIDYFKKEYPGKKTLKSGKVIENWKSKLADRLSPIAGVKRDSIMRRFQKGRSGEARRKEETEREYKELGEQLPPIPPDNGFHVSGVIWVEYSEECEERYPDYDLSYEESVQLIRMAHGGMGEAAVSNGYNDKDIDDPEPYGLCREPQLTFTPR